VLRRTSRSGGDDALAIVSALSTRRALKVPEYPAFEGAALRVIRARY
jgi:hypothetical protein